MSNQSVYGAVIKNSASLQKAFVDHLMKVELLPTRDEFLKGLKAESNNQVIMNFNIIMSAIALIEKDKFKPLALMCTPSNNDAIKTANKIISSLRIMIQASDINSKINLLDVITNRAIAKEEEEKEEKDENKKENKK